MVLLLVNYNSKSSKSLINYILWWREAKPLREHATYQLGRKGLEKFSEIKEIMCEINI